MKKYILLIPIFFLSILSIANAQTRLPGSLVDADWLSDNIGDVIILDARKQLDTFTKEGHIENAILVNTKKIRMDRMIDGKNLISMRPDAKSFQTFMRQHGINNDSQVIITHQGKKSGQVAGAARLYWHMKYYGFDNVALLDGGNAAWVDALGDLTNESGEVAHGNYTVGKEHPEILATMQQVRDSINDSSVTLIDTRELRFHIGIDQKDYVFASGHIPGSKNLPYKLLNPTKGTATYFQPEKILNIISALRINMDNSLILYCNSAYECSSDWFVFHEILGKKDVRIYDGSLHQWTQYKSNPMTRITTRDAGTDNKLAFIFSEE